MEAVVPRRLPDGSWETVLHDARLPRPDTLSVAAGGHLHVTADRLSGRARYQGGQDLRRTPCSPFRTPIGAGPVGSR
jgi:hypothetical protein